MNETWNWDDLRLFLAVARAGGLAGAVADAGASPPTLGRRVAALEKALGAPLFRRHRGGYDLTPRGRELLALAEDMERRALRVDRWRGAADPAPVVRVAAGEWTGAFLARHLAALAGDGGVSLEVLGGVTRADLLRREANLGLRNRRPETPGLAGRRLARVAFAVFGQDAWVRDRPEAADERRFTACPWIAFAPPGPKVPSAVWLDGRLGGAAPALRCSSGQAVLAAAAAGVGLCVLPCFIGDAAPGLARASGPIDALAHDQWLVSHDDDRHAPPIRRVAGRLADLIRSHRDLFGGGRPAQGASKP